MTLLNDFFTILGVSKRETGFSTLIELNPDHIIYSGHFPGQPVTPGVVQLQIVHELIEWHFERPVKLLEVPSCKFLKILNPQLNSEFSVDLEIEKTPDEIEVKASGKIGADIIFKVRSKYHFWD